MAILYLLVRGSEGGAHPATQATPHTIVVRRTASRKAQFRKIRISRMLLIKNADGDPLKTDAPGMFFSMASGERSREPGKFAAIKDAEVFDAGA